MPIFKLFVFILLFSISLSYGEKYPSIPKDSSKLPAPIQKEITNIANLCRFKTIEQKVKSLKKSIESLEKTIPYYFELGNAPYVIHHGLSAMSLTFHKDDFMLIYLDKLFNRPNLGNLILYEYLNNRARNYNLSDVARDPKTAINCFSYNWEHDIYRGFYCMAYNKPPPKYKRKLGHNCW